MKPHLSCEHIFKRQKITSERVFQKKNRDTKTKRKQESEVKANMNMKNEKTEDQKISLMQDKDTLSYVLEELLSLCNSIFVAEILSWSGSYD